MPVFTFILMAVIGLVFLVIGWLLWKEQRISLLHTYHYAHVKQEDRPAYTAMMGKACLALGLGCFLCAVMTLPGLAGWGWGIFALLFLAGLGMMASAQRRYNRR